MSLFDNFLSQLSLEPQSLHYLKKHLGGEPPIEPIYPVDHAYSRQNHYEKHMVLTGPTVIQRQYAKEPVPPKEHVNLPSLDFTEDEFNMLFSKYDYHATVLLFQRYLDLNGNFVVLADRMERTVPEVQHWYYEIYYGILRQRKLPIPYPPFDYQHELKRRRYLDDMMSKDHEESFQLAMSYYDYLRDKKTPSGYKKLPESEVSRHIPVGMPGSHVVGKAIGRVKESREKEYVQDLVIPPGCHLLTHLLPQVKASHIDKAHQVIMNAKPDSLLASSLYPIKLSKVGGVTLPTMPIVKKYLKLRELAMRVHDMRNRKHKIEEE